MDGTMMMDEICLKETVLVPNTAASLQAALASEARPFQELEGRQFPKEGRT
jgi:hypothetical protein